MPMTDINDKPMMKYAPDNARRVRADHVTDTIRPGQLIVRCFNLAQSST